MLDLLNELEIHKLENKTNPPKSNLPNLFPPSGVSEAKP
mgnify:CR=1 FL=1